MQEGDIQIKGYPLRLPLDVLLVFHCQSRGLHRARKIITPLKDRIGARNSQHYPASLEEGRTITAQRPGWAAISGKKIDVPQFFARSWKEIGLFKLVKTSAWIRRCRRQPASAHHFTLESLVSSAEQRRRCSGRTIRRGPRGPTFTPPSPPSPAKWRLEYEGGSKARTPSPANSFATMDPCALEKHSISKCLLRRRDRHGANEFAGDGVRAF